jgi:fructose-1,6-bisphosphatase/inositol monophosphatase family enzyme
MNEYLEFAKTLATQAGEIMIKYFDSDVSQREKADQSIVTVADEEINQMVIDKVEIKYPNHSVFGEEISNIKGSTMVWSCDPIDGTFLFSKGIPCSVFSLALVEDGIPIVGVVYDPFLKNLYTACKAGGSFLNGNPIRVSDKHLDYKAALDMEDWPNSKIDLTSKMKRAEAEKGLDFYSIGSVVYVSCLVARGMFEAVLFAGTNKKSVDISAVMIIVEEAGGKVTDVNGNEQKYDGDINGAVISNGVVHDELIEYINTA